MNPFETPQEMVRQLSGMPLTILLAMFVAERLPMSETAVGLAVACTRKSARKHLIDLKERGLIFKVKRFNGWDLTQQAKQLPFSFLLPTTTQIENGRSGNGGMMGDGMGKNYPSTGKNDPSAPAIHRENGLIPAESGAKGKDYPSLGKDYPSLGKDYPSDTPLNIGRKIERKIVINNIDSNPPSPFHPVTVSLLRRLGLAGDLEVMAWGMPAETWAAWWMVQWADTPRGALAGRLRSRTPADPVYVKLAEWRMLARDDEVKALLTVLLIADGKRPSSKKLKRDLPDGVTFEMYDVAAIVYKQMGDLPLWN